jgi:hypothetical protein
MSASNRFDLRVELGILLGGDRKDREDSKNPPSDGNVAPRIFHAVQGNASSRLNVDALSQRSKGRNLEPMRIHEPTTVSS